VKTRGSKYEVTIAIRLTDATIGIFCWWLYQLVHAFYGLLK